MYWLPWRWTRDGWLGAGLAVVLSGLTAVVSVWLEAPFVAYIAAVGAVVGFFVGGRLGALAIATDRPVNVAIRAALQATLVVIVVLVVPATISPFLRPPETAPDPLVESLFALLVGPVYVAVFGLPAAIAVGLVAVGVRRAFGRRRRLLTGVLATLLVGTVLAGSALAVDSQEREARRAAGLPDLERAGWLTLARAPTRLEYVVVNRARQAFVVAINEPIGPGESSGSLSGIGPCSVVAARLPLGPDWSVHIAPGSMDETEADFGVFDLAPIASSSDTPGRDPRIRIEIGADGSTTVARDQPLPSDAEFLASAC